MAPSVDSAQSPVCALGSLAGRGLHCLCLRCLFFHYAPELWLSCQSLLGRLALAAVAKHPELHFTPTSLIQPALCSASNTGFGAQMLGFTF